MYTNLIQNKLKQLGKPFLKTGDEWCVTTCLNPAHTDTKPSFSINLLEGAGRCFSCGYSVTPAYWVDGELDDEQIEALNQTVLYSKLKERLRQEEQKTSTTFLPPRDASLEAGWRGLTQATIDMLDLYICRTGKYKNRIIFPMKDKNGNVVAFNSRLLDGEEVTRNSPKYKYSYGIPLEGLVYPFKEFRPSRPYIVLVEGIMDAISMCQAGIPAIMNYGVNYTFGEEKIAQLIREGVETIYLGLDNDPAGRRGTLTYLFGDALIKNKPVSKISQEMVDFLYEKVQVRLPKRDATPLSGFFEVQLAQNLPELKEFYNSNAKDFNEFLQTQCN